MTMALDRDVTAAAALLVARYGDRARLHAAHRAGKLLEPRDTVARQLWIEVIHAIDAVQRRGGEVGLGI